MPKYKFGLTNGKTLTLEGDTQPSDDEVESIAKEQGVKLQSVDTTPAAKPETITLNPEQYQTETTPPPNTPEPEQGWLSKAWHAISDPLTDAPSRIAHSMGESIDQPSLERSPGMARVAGFGAGALQGIGDLISGLSSPLNIATAAMTGGASLAESQGLPTAARLLNIGGRIASAPIVAHGAGETLNYNSTLPQRAQGLVEIAGGIAGMKSGESIPSKSTLNIDLTKTPDVFNHMPDITGKTIMTGERVRNLFNMEPKEALSKGLIERDNSQGTTGYRVIQSNKTPGPKTIANEGPKIPIGQTIIIKSGKVNKNLIGEATKQGFVFEGLNDQGHFRFRKASEPIPTQTESGVGTHRLQIGPDVDTKKGTAFEEAANFPRTVMASVDMSAPLRQGLGLIHKKEFWNSLPDMMKAWGSEDAFNQIQQSIADKPLFRPRVDAQGKSIPSFAQDAGLKLTDLHDITNREESLKSSWAEKVPGVRRSNRAYTAFLNKLRADTFESLVEQGKVFGADSTVNAPLAKDLANFVNIATGRGPLSTTIMGKKLSLESSANALSTVFFSPRLIASRLQMMDPRLYITGPKQVRMEALKSLGAIAGVASLVTGLGSMAGGTVEKDPASSDFGKLKIGNTRIDPYGGFQQYIVAMQRLMPNLAKVGIDIGGRMKSTTTGREYDLGSPQFGQSNRADVLTRFLRGKTNPIINFGWGLLAGQKELSGKKMNITTPNPFENAIAQRFIPMLMQDFYDLYGSKETPLPAKIGAGALSAFGMGSQTYGNK